MDEFKREDLITSISGTIEKNYCAIKRKDLFRRYNNTDTSELKTVLEAMKRRGLLKYDSKTDKYRLVK